MFENATYNLMVQLVQENKALYRIKHHYLTDCEGNEAEAAFWQKMEQDKTEHIQELTDLIKQRLS